MDFQPLFFKVPIKIMISSKKRGNESLRRSEFHSIMKISGRGGREEWKSPRTWDCTVSNIVAVSIVKKKGSWAPHPITTQPPEGRGEGEGGIGENCVQCFRKDAHPFGSFYHSHRSFTNDRRKNSMDRKTPRRYHH
jgi:hypothetical protein